MSLIATEKSLQKEKKQRNDDFDLIDLIDLIAIIWNNRFTIVFGVIFIIFISIALNEYNSKYHSEGFYKISGITPVNYKKYQSALLNTERFQAYAKEVGLNENLTDQLSSVFSTKNNTFSKIAPLIYSITPKDTKEFAFSGNKDKDKERPDYEQFLGIQLNVPAASGKLAKEQATIIAEYFIDTVMFVDLSEWLRSKAGQKEEKKLEIARKLIKANQEIIENTERISATQETIKRNPNSLKFEPQIFSTDGKDRFMPPVMQIVGAESQITEAKILISKLNIEKLKLEIISKFYDSSVKLLELNISGKTIFSKIEDIKKNSIDSLDFSNQANKEALNEIEIEIETRKRLYFQDFRFITGPTTPDNKEKISIIKIVSLSSVMGLFFMIIFIFLTNWWKKIKLNLIK